MPVHFHTLHFSVFSLNSQHHFKAAAYIKSGSAVFSRAHACVRVPTTRPVNSEVVWFIRAAQKSPAAELFSPLLKLGLNYSQGLEKMAARRPINAGRQHAARRRFIASGILPRRHAERFPLSEAVAICSPAAQSPPAFE